MNAAGLRDPEPWLSFLIHLKLNDERTNNFRVCSAAVFVVHCTCFDIYCMLFLAEELNRILLRAVAKPVCSLMHIASSFYLHFLAYRCDLVEYCLLLNSPK